MLGKFASILLFIVGLINIAPMIVFFIPNQTKKLYGLTLENETLSILMRHRGVLLGIVGIALIYAAFKSEVRMAVILAAFISKITFIFLTLSTNNYNSEIKSVAFMDGVAMILLGIVVGIYFYDK